MQKIASELCRVRILIYLKLLNEKLQSGVELLLSSDKIVCLSEIKVEQFQSIVIHNKIWQSLYLICRKCIERLRFLYMDTDKAQ